jgi:hypothetical protein
MTTHTTRRLAILLHRSFCAALSDPVFIPKDSGKETVRAAGLDMLQRSSEWS